MDLALFSLGPTGWGDELIAGLDLTLRLAVTAIIAGTALGLVSALGEIAPVPLLGRLLETINMVLRSVPELLVIFLIYYGAAIALAALLAPFGFSGFLEINRFWSGVLALALIHAAYASEVFRGAFLAIPAGQIDAARAFGMSPLLVFFRIRLPLAFRLAMPGLTNLVMTTLKSTPLVSAIGLQDLIRVAGDAGQNTKEFFQFYMATLVIYLGIAAVVLLLQTRSERRLFRHLRVGR
ncbi:MAG TPA: ABC transporter permease subunit [Aestuariivirgaceae bacterium]|nr:ABC transporter permease subunit [Aestuariivirgaceae bacterium]